MNITVLVKPVPYKSIVDNDGNVVRNKIKNIINKDDKCAIEESLKIKEKLGGKVTSISMTIKGNTTVLKDILAYGIDDAILLSDSIFAGSDTNATAYVLSCAIRKIKSDLIICGKVSSDSATSQVGIGVATKLNIPFLYNVNEIIDINEKIIKCKIINGNKYEIIESKLPCVVIVNDTINIPRISTINNRLLASKKEIITWDSTNIDIDINKCGFNGSVTSVVKTTPLITNKETKEITGTKEEKINKLINIMNNCFFNNKSYDKYIKINKTNIEYWIYDNDFNSTCKLIAKCYRLKKDIKIVIVTFNNSSNELFKYGADKIINININNDNYLVKAKILEKLVSERIPNVFLFNKTNEGKILSAYLASSLNLGLSADCVNLELDNENRLVQIRSAYGGRMLANIISKNCKTQMATVLPNDEKLLYNENNFGEIETIDINTSNNDINVLESNVIKETYLDKDIIIACGMGGVKELDNLKEIAKLLDASIGITRDVCDKDYLNTNYLIGQSGKITNSKIYLAFGISGAIEHVVGINSDIVISINNDSKAPINKISDYYINEDINEFVPMLLNKLMEDKNE